MFESAPPMDHMTEDSDLPEINLPAPPFAAPGWSGTPTAAEASAPTTLQARLQTVPEPSVLDIPTSLTFADDAPIVTIADPVLAHPEFPSISPPIEEGAQTSTERRTRDRRFAKRHTPDRRTGNVDDYSALPPLSAPTATWAAMPAPAPLPVPSTPQLAFPAAPAADDLSVFPFPDLVPQRTVLPPEPTPIPQPAPVMLEPAVAPPSAQLPPSNVLPEYVVTTAHSPAAWFPSTHESPPPMSMPASAPAAALATDAAPLPLASHAIDAPHQERPRRFERIMWMIVVPATAGVGIGYVTSLVMH